MNLICRQVHNQNLGFGDGGQGISSLSTPDLEDETMDSVRSGIVIQMIMVVIIISVA